jgi:hypothetical protein
MLFYPVALLRLFYPVALLRLIYPVALLRLFVGRVTVNTHIIFFGLIMNDEVIS